MTREGPLQYGSTRGTREYPALSKYLPRLESLSSPELSSTLTNTTALDISTARLPYAYHGFYH